MRSHELELFRVCGKMIYMINIPAEWIGGINIAVIVFYIFFLLRGARRGFLLQILSTFGTLAAFLASWRYCGFASGYYRLFPQKLNPMTNVPLVGDAVYSYLNQIIWFVALFLIIRLVFMILEKLVSGISELPVVREVSGLLGALFGGVAATVWILVICTVLYTPIVKNGKDVAGNTLIGTISRKTSEIVTQVAGPISTSEVFSKLYTNAKDLNDKDKEFLENWLSEHGLEPLDDRSEAE